MNGVKIGDAFVSFELSFLDDRFSAARIYFKSEAYFDLIRNAFIERYGPPHSTTEQVLKNRMGAEFVNPVLVWKGPTLSIQLRKYRGTITDGMAIISTHEFDKEFVESYKQKGKAGAKDL